ncbi:putative ascorbate ferrireductase (transmembrane) [Arabidopsis thaliana]
MGSVDPSRLSLVLFARLSGLVVAVSVLYWALFLPNLGLSYSTLHPLLMVIGFILVSGEAILIHRWLPGSRKTKKAVHLWLQGMALASAVFGIWTKFHYQRGVFANFYSLHSWMGLLSVSLFAAQVRLFPLSTTNQYYFYLHIILALSL